MVAFKDGHASSRKRKRKAAKRNARQQKARQQIREQVKTTRDQVDEKKGLPFEDLLSMDRIVETIGKVGYEFRERIYPPWVTLWGFLSQVCSPDSSCNSVVTRINAYRTLNGIGQCSVHASSYSEARQRLPEELYATLARDIGRGLAAQSRGNWLWKNRHVKIVDGTTVTMPDTEANQKAYPQSSNQKPGVGFPIMRITALFSLSVGTVVDAEMSATKGKKTGELTAFRELWRSLDPGDILLGDCLYDGYGDIAQLRGRGVDVVLGMKQSRARDFRRGEQLGRGDHIVTWKKPQFDKSRMDRETWEALPDTMRMREVTETIKDANNTYRTITVVTSLLDPKQYSKEDILHVFGERWHCEVDLRSVKTVMGMEHLSCKSPEMVRKEVWTYFLAYNLIRVHMARAADEHDVQPRHLSFNHARQAIGTFTLAVVGVAPEKADELYRQTLTSIAAHRVGNRKGRAEPRKIKRRKGKYPYMTKPRSEAQNQAEQGSAS